MSRLYLTLFILLVIPLSLMGQVKLKDLVKFADEQYKKGNYYYAIDFYKKFGFVVTSDIYLDAEIPHRDMTLDF